MSDKIQLIIWSRDRACQVETLLHSIETFAPDIFETHLIYSCSGKDFYAAYDKLAEERDDHYIHLKVDGRGKSKLLELMEGWNNKQVALATDDTVLYIPIPAPPVQFMEDCDIFSLRLGKNTIVQNYATGEYQPILQSYDVEFYGPYAFGDLDKNPSAVVYAWNFLNYHPHCNYGYPFGLDMHVYNKSMLLPIVERCSFDKPNELETELFKFRSHINPRMKCFDQSCAVNVPITNMSTITTSEGVSLEMLNGQYLAGKKLRYKFDKPIIGCHQILAYEFV